MKFSFINTKTLNLVFSMGDEPKNQTFNLKITTFGWEKPQIIHFNNSGLEPLFSPSILGG